MGDYFGHASTVESHHRCTTRHGLNHRQAKGLVEVNRVKQGECPAQKFVPFCRVGTAHKDNIIAVQMGADFPIKIARILNNAGHDQFFANPSGDLDGLLCPLVRMDSAEKKQIVTRFRPEGKLAQVNAVVNSGNIVKLGAAVCITNGDVIDSVVVFFVYRQYLGRRKTVNGGQHRGRSHTRVGKGQVIEVIMDEIEFVSLFEQLGDVQAFPNLG